MRRKRRNKNLYADSEEIKDHYGNIYASKREMCDFYGVSLSLFLHRLERGYTLQQALEGKEMVYDIYGNKFSSLTEMCKYHGITTSLYNSRVSKGITGDALYQKGRIEKRASEPAVDYLGNQYPSVNSMCRAYEINRSTFLHRLRDGWSLEDALTKKALPPKKEKMHTLYDHNGNRYDSIIEMCNAYDVPYITFHKREEKGWSLQECLEGKK